MISMRHHHCPSGNMLDVTEFIVGYNGYVLTRISAPNLPRLVHNTASPSPSTQYHQLRRLRIKPNFKQGFLVYELVTRAYKLLLCLYSEIQ